MFDIDQFISDLRERESISVPYLQRYFDISYGDAHALIEQLHRRGWVTRPEYGVEYRVCRKKINFRRLSDEETASLAKDFTSDCVSALRCLMKTGFADFAALEKTVRGEDDTRDAVGTLAKLGLIAQGSNEYFLTVDRGSANRVITASRKVKRCSPFDD